MHGVIAVKFQLAFSGMGVGSPGGLEFLVAHRGAMLMVQIALLVLLWIAAYIYIAGPRAISWPILDWFYHLLPWRRKRLERDFSAMLAILLDAEVPEPEAVVLAAECTASRSFQQRAHRVLNGLSQGLKLPEAVQAMDETGEFRWRLTNACHAHTGFLQALAGWHEALDAKAFQQEQAAAHTITTALVLLNGVFVGTVVISVFMFLVSLMKMEVLW